MKFLEDIILKLGAVDRRVIFVLIGLAVLIPLLTPISLPVRETPTTVKFYDGIEDIPKNSKVLVSFDYGPSTRPEIHPMNVGVLRHMLRNGHQIYISCLWPDGIYMALDALEEITDEVNPDNESTFDIKEYEDYILLGYRPGAEAVIKGLASDLRKVYTVDANGNFIDWIKRQRHTSVMPTHPTGLNTSPIRKIAKSVATSGSINVISVALLASVVRRP